MPSSITQDKVQPLISKFHFYIYNLAKTMEFLSKQYVHLHLFLKCSSRGCMRIIFVSNINLKELVSPALDPNFLLLPSSSFIFRERSRQRESPVNKTNQVRKRYINQRNQQPGQYVSVLLCLPLKHIQRQSCYYRSTCYSLIHILFGTNMGVGVGVGVCEHL